MVNRPLKAVVVEDNETLCRMFAENLRADPLIRTVQAGTLQAGLELARAEPHPVLLVDLGLPDATGTDAVPALRRAAPGATLVVITGDPDLKDDALLAGAHAVIVKGTPESHGDGLVHAVRAAVINHELELMNAPANRRLERVGDTLEAAKKLLPN